MDYRNNPYSDEGIWGAASNGDLDRLKKKLMGMGLFQKFSLEGQNISLSR